MSGMAEGTALHRLLREREGERWRRSEVAESPFAATELSELS